MSLQLRNVRKSFGAVSILDGIDLAMDAREFIAFLGPSGSGKSTLLRIIAGLEFADEGEVWLEERRIDQLPPGRRGVAMVFQHYALYPHMSVRENMGFGLKNAGMPRAEIGERVAEAARILEIEDQLDKKPGQMSGGQRQRVAIGRAIVKKPKLFLLDEPLSNLDAALRLRTRMELAQLRQRVEAGIIMVTHDQAEAMTLADRIVVMNDRKIQQVGAPMDIYARPENIFVARFVGSPAMTVAPIELVEGAGGYATVRLGSGASLETRIPRARLPADAGLQLGVRPEHVRVTSEEGHNRAKVELVERLGERTLIYARLSDGLPITAEDGGFSQIKMGDEISLQINGAAVHIFGPDGQGYHAEPQSA